MRSTNIGGTRSARRRGGYSLLEIIIVVALFATILASAIAVATRDGESTRATVRASVLDQAAARLLGTIESELAAASVARPMSDLTVQVGAGTTTIQVASTAGFPPSSTLVIDRGEPGEETVAYGGLGGGETLFLDCERGQECSVGVAHDSEARVLWTGLAEILDQQDPPPDPDAYDGIALESEQPMFFRGRGTGFSYRVPVDPSGAGDFLVGDELQLGAEIPGLEPSLDGRMAIYFQPRTVLAEADRGRDVNQDGDTEDEFDVGQLRQVVWDVTTPAATARDVGIGPALLLQERCNHGSDLDGDGFEDPMFLWDALTSELHVRLFLVDTNPAQGPVTRAVNSVLFLRNEAEL